MWTETRQHPPQGIEFERDAAGGRSKAFSCGVDEDRTAASGNAWARIVINLDDEIVEIVAPSQSIGRRFGRHFDPAIVPPVGRVLAPSIVGRNSLHRQRGRRSRMLVGAPPQLPQAETAARRTTIAFALVGLDPATTKCHW